MTNYYLSDHPRPQVFPTGFEETSEPDPVEVLGEKCWRVTGFEGKEANCPGPYKLIDGEPHYYVGFKWWKSGQFTPASLAAAEREEVPDPSTPAPPAAPCVREALRELLQKLNGVSYFPGKASLNAPGVRTAIDAGWKALSLPASKPTLDWRKASEEKPWQGVPVLVRDGSTMFGKPWVFTNIWRSDHWHFVVSAGAEWAYIPGYEPEGGE